MNIVNKSKTRDINNTIIYEESKKNATYENICLNNTQKKQLYANKISL